MPDKFNKVQMSGFLQSRNVRFSPFESVKVESLGTHSLRSGAVFRHVAVGRPVGSWTASRSWLRRAGAASPDEVHRGREPLVLNDFSLPHAVILRERGRPQLVLAVPEAQRAVLPLFDADPLSSRSPRRVGRVQDVQHALVVQSQALRDQRGSRAS